MINFMTGLAWRRKEGGEGVTHGSEGLVPRMSFHRSWERGCLFDGR